jgi:hypothetical protein
MKLTPKVLRAVVIAGVATFAPLVAASPAFAGGGMPQGPAAAVASPPWEAAADVPPGPNVAVEAPPWEAAADVPPGPNVVGPEIGLLMADVPPGPTAGIIAI